MTISKVDGPSNLVQSQVGSVPLKIGAQLSVPVTGPTRHGLLVQLGPDPFVLKTSSALDGAKSLTLKITGSSKANHQVQITASDSRPLAEPVRGELTPRQTSSPIPPSTTTINEGHHIEVTARPVASDGRYLGPAISVRLAILPTAEASATKTEAHQPAKGMSTSAFPVSAPAGKSLNASEENSFSKAGLISPLPSKESGPPETPHQDLPVPKAKTALPTDTVWARKGEARPMTSGGGSITLPTVPARSTGEAFFTKEIPAHQVEHRGGGQGLMTATAIGRAAQGGQLLLQITDDLIMKVDQPIDLPVGARLQMTMMTGSANPAQPVQADLPKDEMGLLAKLVALLDDIESSGRASGERAAVSQRPMPDRHLAAKLLQLFGLQIPSGAGEVGAGPQYHDGAEVSKTHLLKPLLMDIADMASEPLADDWRGTTLPFGEDPALALMIFHKCCHSDDDTGGDPNDADSELPQRAIFDVNFSHLGRCQIDAFCQGQQFDLLIRSERRFEQVDQQRCTDLFASACDMAGLTGEMNYHCGNFVTPPQLSKVAKSVTT